MRSLRFGALSGASVLVLCLVAGCGPARPGAHTPTLEPGTVWRTYVEAGDKATAQGRYGEAEAMYLAALKDAEGLRWRNPEDPKAPPLVDPAVPATLKRLGDVYALQGRNTDAESAYRRALTVASAQAGPDDPFAGLIMFRLGMLYRTEGKDKEAEPLLKQAATIQEKIYGTRDPAVAASLNGLGDVYAAEGRTADAELFYRRALAIREAALGPDHPDVAESLDSLVAVYFTQGKVSEAKQLHKRALGILAKSLGPDHPRVVASLNRFAEMLKRAEGPPAGGGSAAPAEPPR